jgi:hypothetical protein
MNDQISSIRVFGNAEVTVYEDRNYMGRSRTFTADVRDLKTDGWNDVITSYRVQPGSGGAVARWGRPATPVNGACFYENLNFDGLYFCARQGESVELVPEDANDRISSIRLFGNAEVVVYRDRDFTGDSQWFDVSEPDLRESGWNDTISSYQVQRRGAVGNRARGASRGVGSAEPTTGAVDWRGRVDDRVQLVIRGRSLEERTVSGTSQAMGRTVFSSGLPAVPVQVNVLSLSGRGAVRVIQQPSRLNGFTAIVEIHDSAGGADDYRLRVTWR